MSKESSSQLGLKPCTNKSSVSNIITKVNKDQGIRGMLDKLIKDTKIDG